MTVASGPADSPVLADAAGAWSAAYVHVPFCARLCPYCDFAVVAGRDEEVGRYVAALQKEIGLEPEWRSLDAVYVGGGTPSRLTPEKLGAVVRELRDRFGLNDHAEVSLEANPEDWSPGLADGLRHAGFNRVSFGVQSFDPDVLRSLGRMPCAVAPIRPYDGLKRHNFRSTRQCCGFWIPRGLPLAAFESRRDPRPA